MLGSTGQEAFRDFLETAPDAMVVVNQEGMVVLINTLAERLFGYARETLIGRSVETLLPERFRSRHVEHRRRYLAHPSVRPMGTAAVDLFARHMDGHEFPVEISLSPLETADAVLVVSAVRELMVDVTERKITQVALRKSEDRLRLLLETTRVIPWESDAKTGRFTYVGPQALQLGYPIEQWYEPDFWVPHMHPDDRADALAFCLESSRQCEDYEFEYRMMTSGGDVVWLHDLVTVVRVDGQPDTLRGFMIDITERKRAEATLKDLRRRLIHAQEEERRRVARELHDDLNQRLASLAIETGLLRQQLTADAEPVRGQLASLQERLVELSEDVRHMSHELHPGILEHLGLASAIRALCREFHEHAGILTEVSVQLDPQAIPWETALSVYRVTQEALRNVARHSAAKEVRVSLVGAERHIDLAIVDSGVGFVSEQVEGRPGLGLLSMEERVRLLGGTFLVQSVPGEGTEIKVRLPVGEKHRNG